MCNKPGTILGGEPCDFKGTNMCKSLRHLHCVTPSGARTGYDFRCKCTSGKWNATKKVINSDIPGDCEYKLGDYCYAKNKYPKDIVPCADGSSCQEIIEKGSGAKVGKVPFQSCAQIISIKNTLDSILESQNQSSVTVRNGTQYRH